MTIQLNATHDGTRRSWIGSANSASAFPIQNLPFGVFRRRNTADSPRGGIAIGDMILDVSACASHFGGLARSGAEALGAPDLNAFMALGPHTWSELRLQVFHLLDAENLAAREQIGTCLIAIADAELLLPARIPNFADFFASMNHALNAGRMFRPTEPLFPNYKHVPIAYNGRTSSIVVSGTPIRRPSGQVLEQGAIAPVFRESRQLDYETELGIYIGTASKLGMPVSIDDAWQHIFGFCLLNDWSARDIQAWEYQPLGPFLGKSFGTSVSPWIITAEALWPFRVPAFLRDEGDPRPLPHLYAKGDQQAGAIDINILCSLRAPHMKEPLTLSRASTRDLYWTPAQFIAHQTSNGCNLEIGDVLGSGTVSGTGPNALGSLLEITARGAKPFDLGGEPRSFLEDGDEVCMTGSCSREGFATIGFGDCKGTIAPAI